MRCLSILLLAFLACPLAAQERLFVNNSPDEVVRLDSRTQQFDIAPGQILVKFKDAVPIRPERVNGLGKTNVASVDALMQRFQVTTVQKLFEKAEPLREKKVLKDFAGRTFEQPSLHNIYKLELRVQREMFEAIEAFKNDPNVEYAEPNHIFSIVGAEPVSEILTEDELNALQQSTIPNRQSSITPNDPLYSQQWYIPAIRADEVWATATGDTTQIIGILDTGVDWLHPDLATKIWSNNAERNGIPGVDDDGNGFVDDMRGWDFINNDNDPRDDNSHGTHVAGIAAAEANNGIGIAGVNWHAKIMPIKVFQSSGRGDAATITQGIWYAINKGATVLNMSFGSYARSLTMENALAYAYAQAVLVAASGNDGCCINCIVCGGPFFPAALSYVLGVQATDQGGGLAGFSNADDDGPVFSRYPDLLNYELRGPGVALISTIPNGNYRAYSGTSMAAAVVSGAVAIYRSVFPVQSQEIMWGNLINTTSGHLNLFSAMQVQGQPKLWFVSQTLVDTLDGDRDGRVDAGETIELWFMVRNTWIQADSVFVGIRFGEFEDTTTAQIIKPRGFVGSISPYARRSNERDPLRIHISPNVINDRDIVFEASLWSSGATDTVRQRVVLTVENGEELAGVMDSTLALTPDKLWLINSSFRVGSNGTLILSPGTRLIYKVDFVNRGKVIARGTRDSMVVIKSGSGFPKILGSGFFQFSYTKFQDQANSFGSDPLSDGSFTFDHCTFENLYMPGWGPIFQGRHLSLIDCQLLNSKSNGISLWGQGDTILRNTFRNSELAGYSVIQSIFPGLGIDQFFVFKHNNFVGIGERGALLAVFNSLSSSHQGNNFAGFLGARAVVASGTRDIVAMPGNYWGTTDSARIQRDYVADFWDDPSLPMLQFWPPLTAPSDSAHGIVWKVLVNGIDPQDQRNLLNPLGVGPHRFDVYFNRSMDTTYTPQLSFGVREPYNQQSVRDSARWSADGRIWTAYKTIQLHTGDGINRIRVAGARDPEGFEIPIEDMRFEFLINAAGAASAGFTATAGLGKVTLEWEAPELTDILGYNLYRFTNITDSTYTEPILLNPALVIDTTYTDFNVVPGRRYYYQYRVVRTNLTETDPSRIVSTIPLTAARGDANGDFTVNVLDVVTIVAYILQQNPQPFIFEAADVNEDRVINILDLVGTINLILHPSVSPGSTVASLSGTEPATLRLDRDNTATSLLSLETESPVAGLQITIAGWKEEMHYTRLAGLEQFELARAIVGKDTLILVAYSLSERAIPAGNVALLKLNSGKVRVSSAVLAAANSKALDVKVLNYGEPLIPQTYVLQQNYPNPFNASTAIEYGLPEDVGSVEVVIYDILGRKIRTLRQEAQRAGFHRVVWDGRAEGGLPVASGVYFYQLKVGIASTPQIIAVRKMVLVK